MTDTRIGRMRFPRALIISSVIGTGLSTVPVQLLTVREFLSQFHGNEITISLALSCWLLLTGLGSLAAKVFRHPSPGLYGLLCLGLRRGQDAGFTNFSVMRSDSPIARYFSRSLSPSRRFGGSVHTPFS